MATCSYSQIMGGMCVTCGLEFRIPHIFNLLKLNNVAKIFEVIFACPLPREAKIGDFRLARNIENPCESKPKQRHRKKV